MTDVKWQGLTFPTTKWIAHYDLEYEIYEDCYLIWKLAIKISIKGSDIYLYLV